MAQVPHFDLPFRWNGNKIAVVEQDSLEDVTNCVQAILLTRLGERLERPDFGIGDPVFLPQPLPLGEILNDILESEPRAQLLLQQAPDRLDQLIVNVTAMVNIKEEG